MARTPLFFWLTKRLKTAFHENTAMTRRDFLKGLAGAAALGATASPVLRTLAALPSSSLDTPDASPESGPQADRSFTGDRVIIVGGGLAGLATAYHLSMRGVPCAVYEASSRLGGRMFTRRDFNRDGMFVELGGELVDSNHAELLALCRALSVPVEAFEPFDADVEPAVFFSGGRIRREAEVISAFRPLVARLARDLRRCFPDGEVAIPTRRQPYQAAELDRTSLADYLDDCRDVAPWLIRLIQTAYTGEYGLDPEEQSALNLLLLIGVDPADATLDGESGKRSGQESDGDFRNGGFRIYGSSDEALRIQGGGGRLIDALERALRPTVPIYAGHALNRIAERDGRLRLSFQRRETAPVSGNGPRVPDTHRLDIAADRVVLAMPFSVLRRISGISTLPLSPVKKQCIAEWGYGTNSKLMLGFRSRFWRESGGASSVSHSVPPANSGEVYSDLPSQAFWETSRLQPGRSGILTNFLGGNAGRNAHPGRWRQALDDLGVLYPQAAAQTDGNRFLMNWYHHSWARGSYSCPRPGQYTTLMGVAGEPELDGRLFFAGEHCSVDWAGYMNGAAHSALQVTAQIAGEPFLSASRRAYLASRGDSGLGSAWGSASESPVYSM